MTTIALHRKAQPLNSLSCGAGGATLARNIIEVTLQGVNDVSACFQVSLVIWCY